MDTLLAAKPSDMSLMLKPLEPLELDLLFKYLYKGMASPERYNASLLLAWHEKLFELGGLGGIVRVLTDRRVV